MAALGRLAVQLYCLRRPALPYADSDPAFTSLSAADEARLAFFLEGGEAFLHVVAMGMHLAGEQLEPQGGLDRLLEPVVDQRLHAAQDERALVAQAGDDLAC